MRKILLSGLAAVVAMSIAVPVALGASAPKATGNVDWVFGSVTGNVTFDAQGTTTDAKGQLAYTNSVGEFLNGVVTCFNKIDSKTAVFSGTITDGSPVYMANPYFVAKVVDNGSSGAAGPDTIAVFVDDVAQNCSDNPGDIHADVTSGNLTVHKA